MLRNDDDVVFSLLFRLINLGSKANPVVICRGNLGNRSKGVARGPACRVAASADYEVYYIGCHIIYKEVVRRPCI
jgi:hypothetical protein